jgi:hypothetical protein
MNPPPDAHPSELGNKIVAEALAEYLSRSLLVAGRK